MTEFDIDMMNVVRPGCRAEMQFACYYSALDNLVQKHMGMWIGE